jgi:hypothetical protein
MSGVVVNIGLPSACGTAQPPVVLPGIREQGGGDGEGADPNDSVMGDATDVLDPGGVNGAR